MNMFFTFFVRIANFFRKAYWKLFKPVTKGIRVLIVKDGVVVLVKHRYDKFWFLPGGKINKNESEEGAAKREALEECGIAITSFQKVLGRYENRKEGKIDGIVVLIADQWKTQRVKKQGIIEIEQVKTFDISNLPTDVSPATRRRIGEFLISDREEYSGSW